ncbi:MAG: hypothetical protein B7Z70_15510 [Acidithiobacillus ferrivorans]|uniref:Uncharacterized protein n=1 Tax=Acidithiobacillus ferrivorans TaxID=160808 RepID=A0A257SFV8_9PROT|nr:MAG: hypothetical protein B7Z70_15510 [Acidithiobacillus ferrivorans]
MVSMEPVGGRDEMQRYSSGGLFRSALLEMRVLERRPAVPQCLGLVAVVKAPAKLMGAASALINAWRRLAGAAG